MSGGSSNPIIRYDLAMPAVVTQVLSPTQFVADGLAGFDSGTYVGYSVWMLTKSDGSTNAPKTESPRLITAFDGYRAVFPTAKGTITHVAFTGGLTVGDTVLILNPAVSGLFSRGGTPIPSANGTATANWQTAEANLAVLGAAGQINIFTTLMVDISLLAGNISIRLYSTVYGVAGMRWYPIPAATTFSVAADAPVIPVIDGPIGVNGQLTVTIQSDALADNGVAVNYEVC